MFCICCKTELQYEMDRKGWVIKEGILVKEIATFASKHQEKFIEFVVCDECLGKHATITDKYIIISDISNG